jgi:uncharacterized protein with von Willebrand factor type A (vWA) domain
MWNYTRTIIMIRQIFPMFELSIDGLEKAVQHLMAAYKPFMLIIPRSVVSF